MLPLNPRYRRGMAGSPITAVVFDLGNVLITWDRELLYRSVIPDDDRRAWFLDNVLTLDENAKLDRGMPLAELTASLAAEHPEWSAEVDAFRTRWIETIGPTIDDTIAIFGELTEADVPCYALSNWGRETFEQAMERFPFLDWFDGRVISGYENTVKPEARIFEILLDRFSLDPASCLFIDDSAANITAANELGFHTMHFVPVEKAPAALRAMLVDHGLLSLR